MTCVSVDHHTFDLQTYHVSDKTGFMLSDPLRILPGYFNPWNELAISLPTLMKKKTFRQAVNKLSQLDHNKLVGHRQKRLAHLQLSLITAGYVWQNGDKGVAQVLPKCVAIPYCKISEQLEVQPIMSFVDLGLANWSLIDQAGPHTFENLACLYHLPELKSGDWFCIVTFMMELSFGKCLKSVGRILDILGSVKCLPSQPSVHETTTEAEIVACLRQVSKATTAMQYALSRMRDHLDAKVFFNVIRPFLDGWGGKNNSLPDGLIYEGVSDIPVQLVGGSGAQSLTLQVLDSLLGVQHTQDKINFLLKMRSYMLPSHRHFVENIEQSPYTLRDFVMLANNQTLTTSYNQCLSALSDLRNYHIQVVKMYVLIPAKKANEGINENLDTRGTGGTNLVPFLGDIRSATTDRLLPGVTHINDKSNRSWITITVNIPFLITAATVAILAFATKFIF